MQNQADRTVYNSNRQPTVFFSAFFNSAGAGFLCSPEHGKLCFEHPETIPAAQNNLPLQGAEKDLRSRLFV